MDIMSRLVVIKLWNLNILRSVTTIQVNALDYVVGVYPLILIILTLGCVAT